MSWQKSHIEDLNPMAGLPYVDYLNVDKQIHSFAMQALNFSKRHTPNSWRGRLITSIKDTNKQL